MSPMIADLPAFVISLSRTPQRLAAFRKNNDGLGLDVRHHEGVDGKEANLRKLVKWGKITETANYKPGMIGSALSHGELWQKAVDLGQTVLVFEDDARLRKDFAVQADGLLKEAGDFDLVMFGFNTDYQLATGLFPGCDTLSVFSNRYPSAADMDLFAASTTRPALLPLRGMFGGCAYAISPKGADALLKACFPLDNKPVTFAPGKTPFPAFSLNGMMNTAYKDIKAYISFPPIVLSPNDQQATTTGGFAAGKR
jgi:GR25 family glycosyltransferase involved in LPS biosynthesis